METVYRHVGSPLVGLDTGLVGNYTLRIILRDSSPIIDYAGVTSTGNIVTSLSPMNLVSVFNERLMMCLNGEAIRHHTLLETRLLRAIRVLSRKEFIPRYNTPSLPLIIHHAHLSVWSCPPRGTHKCKDSPLSASIYNHSWYRFVLSLPPTAYAPRHYIHARIRCPCPTGCISSRLLHCQMPSVKNCSLLQRLHLVS